MSLKTWWQRKSGPAKLVTALTTLLILEMGLCFASPGEPAWFDALFHIHPSPHQIHFGLVLLELYLCIGTFVILLIALLVWATSSFARDDLETTLIKRDAHELDATNHPSGDPK